MLLDHSITPVLVFDGGRMPFKVVEQKRREDRKRAKKEADDLIAAGRMNEAYSQMVQSINVTHEMASNLMKAARKLGVESVVAPYEADAQLVYLEKSGLVDFIISEDSDLIVFGAQKVFLKMTPSGHGDLFDADCVELCLQANKRLKGNFLPQKLLFSAILSGCDYLKNLPGIGLIKAWKFMNMTENTNIRQFLTKIPSYLKLSVEIDDEYKEGFIMAWLAFQYQLVFDTRQKRRVPLHAVTDDVSKDDYDTFLSRFEGTSVDHLQLALGNIDSRQKEYDNYHPHMLSYLYYGVEQASNNITTPESPVLGFSTEGVYKRRQSKRKSLPTEEAIYQEDEDIANYYKNMSPRVVPKKEESPPVQPPRKRIKCKFFKYKSQDDDNDDSLKVQSRFFKSKDEDIITNTPNENIDNQNEDEDDLKKVYKDAGIEFDSEASNDANEAIKTTQKEEMKTPVKDDVEDIVITPDVPESPIITSQAEKIKPKFKEIQNIKSFAKAKKPRIVPKNQPTLLGFFKKL